MSYEGYEEFICENGHYWAVDASVLIYGSDEERKFAYICPHCKKMAQYQCSVDETNGSDPSCPQTLAGTKTEVGFDDVECKDHYGNKYFVKRSHYAPDLDNGRWITL